MSVASRGCAVSLLSIVGVNVELTLEQLKGYHNKIFRIGRQSRVKFLSLIDVFFVASKLF